MNFNKLVYYLFTVSVNKYGVSCSTTDDPYVQNMNVKCLI